MINGTKEPDYLKAIGFSREGQVISFQDDGVFSQLRDILSSVLTYQADPLMMDLYTGQTPSEFRNSCRARSGGNKAFLQSGATNPHRK